MATWTKIRPGVLQSTQALTAPAPTLETEGIDLSGLAAIVPILTAPNGQTFTGGNLRGHVRPPGFDHWLKAPRADDDVGDLLGLNEAALPALPVTSPQGRFDLLLDGVTLSGGASVTVTLVCIARR